MKLAFFANEPLEKDYTGRSTLLKDAGVEVAFFDGPLNNSTVPENTDFEGLSVFVDSVIDKEVLGHFPKLSFIAARSTGFDHIDLRACKEKGIVVSNVPAYGANTVAEHAFALLLSFSKRIYAGYQQVRQDGDFDPHRLRGFDLKGKTLGVIGTGRIGRHSVQIGKGFGMEVIAHDAYPDEAYAKEVGIKYKSLEDLLKESDVITIHVPYMESTHHLINRDTLRHVKRGAYLINTSRGGIVETQALVEALARGQLAGAGLDVLEEEGVIKDPLHLLVSGKAGEHDLKTVLANHVLVDMPNVIITPHSAFNTIEALKRILDTTFENTASFAKGEPINVVELPT